MEVNLCENGIQLKYGDFYSLASLTQGEGVTLVEAAGTVQSPGVAEQPAFRR